MNLVSLKSAVCIYRFEIRSILPYKGKSAIKNYPVVTLRRDAIDPCTNLLPSTDGFYRLPLMLRSCLIRSARVRKSIFVLIDAIGREV